MIGPMDVGAKEGRGRHRAPGPAKQDVVQLVGAWVLGTFGDLLGVTTVVLGYVGMGALFNVSVTAGLTATVAAALVTGIAVVGWRRPYPAHRAWWVRGAQSVTFFLGSGVVTGALVGGPGWMVGKLFEVWLPE